MLTLYKKIFSLLISPNKKESKLQSILIFFIIFELVSLLFRLLFPSPSHIVPTPFLGLILFATIILYLFSRGGYSEIIKPLVVCGLAIASCYLCLYAGIQSVFVFISLLATILCFGILFSSPTIIGSGIILSVSFFLLTFISNKLSLELNFLYSGLYVVASSAFFFIARNYEQKLATTTADLHLAQHQLQKSLVGLRDIPSEKLHQLYRFAEFGRLSSGLFHDLINPITSVNLSITKLQETKIPELVSVKQDIDKVVDSTHHISEIISTIKKQIQTQDFEDVFYLSREIHEAIKILQYKAEKAAVTINFEYTDEIKIYGNPVKFHQICVNLISNAIDAYGASGNGDRTILITMDQKNSIARIKVKDSGAGIPVTILPKIFDPFFTTKPLFSGIGLGLSTTKDVIEKYFHGSIKVESQLHRGSTFTIQIPISESIPQEKHYPDEFQQKLALE